MLPEIQKVKRQKFIKYGLYKIANPRAFWPAMNFFIFSNNILPAIGPERPETTDVTLTVKGGKSWWGFASAVWLIRSLKEMGGRPYFDLSSGGQGQK